MYATNLNEFGRLLETDNYRTHMVHNDLWEIFDNKKVRFSPFIVFVSCVVNRFYLCLEMNGMNGKLHGYWLRCTVKVSLRKGGRERERNNKEP